MILHYSGSVGHDGAEEEPTEHVDIEALVQSLIESGDTLGEAVDDGKRWPPGSTPWSRIDITDAVSRALEAEREHRATYKPLRGRGSG